MKQDLVVSSGVGSTPTAQLQFTVPVPVVSDLQAAHAAGKPAFRDYVNGLGGGTLAFAVSDLDALYTSVGNALAM